MKLAVVTRLFFILSWIVFGWMHTAGAEELPYVQDFTAEAKEARAKEVPILILFMNSNCGYCKRVLQEFLLPMGRNAEYNNKVIMRQVELGSNVKLRDFNGKLTTQGEFTRTHNIQLVPTVALFDAEGHVLADPIVGLLTPDFYGGYLDNAIDEALAKVRSGQVVPRQ